MRESDVGGVRQAERGAGVAGLSARLLARRLAQAHRLLGEAIGAGRLVGVVAVLLELVFQFVNAGDQRHLLLQSLDRADSAAIVCSICWNRAYRASGPWSYRTWNSARVIARL